MQNDFAMAVLSAAASLLDVFAFGFRFLANGLAVGYLRTAHIGLHVVFAQHAVHDNFEVQLAHAGDQCLAGIRLRGDAKRWIFLREPLHGYAQLVLVGFRFRLDGYGNNWGGKIDGFENDLFLFVAKRIAGGYALQAHAGANIACIHGFNFFALIGMHLQQAADAFTRPLPRVVNVAAGLEYAGINADVGNVSDERVGHDFESQRGKRRIVRSAAQNDFIVFGVHAFEWRHIHRRRKVIDDRIEQRLNALVLESRAR